MPSPPMGPSRWLRPRRADPSPPGALSALAARASRCLALLGSLLGASSACELGANFGALGEQLLDPDIQGIDAPGKRWVAGPHFDLNILEGQSGKRYAAARNQDGELVLIDFTAENYCRAGKAVRYADTVRARSRPPLVPLLTERDRGDDAPPELRLTFTTFDCQRSAFSVPVSGLPLRVLQGVQSGSGTSLLVRTPEGGLALVDPWEQTSRRVAEAVRADDPAVAFGYFIWVDRGVIVISDEDVEPVAFIGRNVVAVTASPSDAELAFIEAGAVPGNGGTLYTVDARGSQEPVQVATDACNMRYLTLDGRRKLSYLSPCAERQLVLRDVLDGDVQVVDVNVSGSPSVRELSGQSVLTYVTTESSDAVTGTLWVLTPAQEKIAIAENTRVGPSTVMGDGGLLTVLDWASTGGRLVAWKPDALAPEASTEVAQGVIELGPLGRLANDDLTLLGNFDGVTGDLLRLRADLSTELLAQGVPTRAANADAFLAHFDGQAGDLLLLDRRDGSSQLLGEGVGRGAFIFTLQFRAVLMLAARDPETRTNTLRIHLLRAERDYALHDGVTEAREVAFPSPGILYNVVTGDDAGIWFAKTL